MAAEPRAALLDGLLAPILPGELALTSREHALIAYADKLTHVPSSIRAEDIAQLRTQGLNDLAIHDACAIVAYFAFVNRMADGLGVELEDLI